jgi:thiamine pyrophosphokinase
MSFEKPVAIIANGEPQDENLIKTILEDVHTVIAADEGADICKKFKIIPNIIIGDLDSISTETMNEFSAAEIIYRPDQNSNDLSKALEHAKTLSPTVIKIIALWGKRTDHIVSNLLICNNWDSDIPLQIFDNYGKMSFLNPGHHQLRGNPGETVSFFSLAAIKNLTLKGFRYEVNKKTFGTSFNGLSNIYDKGNVSIEFSKGRLIVYDVYGK